ncbi:MAG TPA: sigma-70 family RNA polymerase sigma factor [Blastocatellia bacterium]|nr:sigma-70 family RNA polymerase sigma factor [Blastocatellia bacterium]
MPDKERITSLVRAAQAGDDLAFAELVRAYQDIAVAYATAIMRDYHLAEDAAQEAFVEAYRELASLREPAAFGAWFRTIIFKHCDRMTRRKRHPAAPFEAALEVASLEPSPEETLELQETKASVWRAIAALSEAERAVLLLYYMGEHSQAVIAEFLNVTTNAVKTRLYSARKRLRKYMGHIEENLNAARPSSDPKFAEKVRRLIRPEALKQKNPWMWSPGIGADVWEMFCACITGDLEAVKRLLDKDPSLVRSHYEYRTPLSFAVRENHVEIAAFLLDHGADPLALGDVLQIARDREYVEMERLLESKIASLHGASSKGEAVAAAIRERDPEKVRQLLDESPELLRAGDGRSNQPIHWAVMTRQIEIIDELLARGADINAQRQDGARPIHLTNGDYHFRGWRDVPEDVVTKPDDVYRHLVARGVYVDIGMAAVKGDLERVRELLDKDPRLSNLVSDYGSYYLGCGAPIKNAAAGGHIEIVKLLLDRGANPNLPEEGIAPHGAALYSAVYNGHYEIAKLLLEHGAYPNPEVESSGDAVFIAIMNGDLRMIDLLASYGAVWNIPVTKGRAFAYEDVAARLPARSAPVLAHYGDVQTAAAMFATNPALADNPEALKNAAGNGHEEFVRLMLRYRPELAKRVTVSRPREMAMLLFEHGMDPNRPNWLRITPLHHFAESGDLEGAAIFIERGADLNARDEEFCSTPLAWAARLGQTRMVEFMLRRGAQPSLPDDLPDLAWATPLAWATRRGHQAIAQLLTAYEQTGALPAHSLEEYDAVARALVEAYQSGDDAAMQLVIEHFQLQRPLTWDQPPREVKVARLRRGVQERLGRRSGAGDESSTLDLADARLLVARSQGFKSWEELAKYIDEPRAQSPLDQQGGASHDPTF